MLALFRSCAQPSLVHLLGADFVLQADPEHPDLYNWTSPFSKGIQTANHAFLATLADLPSDSLRDTASSWLTIQPLMGASASGTLLTPPPLHSSFR